MRKDPNRTYDDPETERELWGRRNDALIHFGLLLGSLLIGYLAHLIVHLVMP